MKKVSAVLLAGLFAAGVYAQSNPPGANVPPSTPGIASDKAQRAGEARKDRRPERGVPARAGDEAKTPEGGAIGTDKAAMNGEKRAETRDMRRPGKMPSTQGGTPK